MGKVFILLVMMFFHIVDDYYLQGWLATAKQKKWWKENVPGKLYEHDYIIALLMHSFSWTFMIMLPIAFNIGFSIPYIFMVLFAINILIHAYTDNAKANRMKINLIQDQIIHILQIIFTFCIFYIVQVKI